MSSYVSANGFFRVRGGGSSSVGFEGSFELGPRLLPFVFHFIWEDLLSSFLYLAVLFSLLINNSFFSSKKLFFLMIAIINSLDTNS